MSSRFFQPRVLESYTHRNYIEEGIENPSLAIHCVACDEGFSFQRFFEKAGTDKQGFHELCEMLVFSHLKNYLKYSMMVESIVARK